MKTYAGFIKESADKNSCLVLVQQLQNSLETFKQLHWNVNGEGFLELHELFGEIYADLQTFQDRVAEKARGMGVYVKIANTNASIENDPEECLNVAIDNLQTLRNGLELLRAGDLTVENILGELAEKLDTFLYKLTSSKEE